MKTLIGPDNIWVLWTILIGSAALAIVLEQKYKWANKVTGCILALVFVMILANLKVIPTDSPVYDSVWDYVVPLAVPMLLFRANIKKIGKESGKFLIMYLFSSLGTLLGSFAAFGVFKNLIPNLNKIIPMFTGTYIGGSVNFAAMSHEYAVSKEINSAALVADNLLMAIYFFVLIIIPTMNFFLKRYKHPHIDKVNSTSSNDDSETLSSKYWGAKEISLKDIALVIASAFIIVTVSNTIANFFGTIIPKPAAGEQFFLTLLNGLLSNSYLIMTTITMVLATVFSNFFGKLPGSQEIGTFLIYIFFAVIGAPASITLILKEAPLLLLVAALIVGINLIVSLIFGKIFKFSIEEIMIASNANVGGPTTSAAMAIAKGWTGLVGPALLVGTLGYVLGNYFGIFVGTMLG